MKKFLVSIIIGSLVLTATGMSASEMSRAERGKYHPALSRSTAEFAKDIKTAAEKMESQRLQCGVCLEQCSPDNPNVMQPCAVKKKTVQQKAGATKRKTRKKIVGYALHPVCRNCMHEAVTQGSLSTAEHEYCIHCPTCREQLSEFQKKHIYGTFSNGTLDDLYRDFRDARIQEDLEALANEGDEEDDALADEGDEQEQAVENEELEYRDINIFMDRSFILRGVPSRERLEALRDRTDKICNDGCIKQYDVVIAGNLVKVRKRKNIAARVARLASDKVTRYLACLGGGALRATLADGFKATTTGLGEGLLASFALEIALAKTPQMIKKLKYLKELYEVWE